MADSDIAETLGRLGSRPIVIATHPRSGTHLTIDLLRKHFPQCRSWKRPGENLNRLYLSLEALFDAAAPSPISQAKALAVVQRVPRPLVKTHFDPDLGTASARPGVDVEAWDSWLRSQATFYYVHRDVRDVMCSYHKLRWRTDPSARCTVGQFIRQVEHGTNRVRYWADHLRRWRGAAGVGMLRFESILADPRGVLERIGRDTAMTPRFLQPLLPSKIRNKWHGRLIRLAGARPEGSGQLADEGGPPLQRWREVFSEADRAFVQHEAGDLLAELGYETSDQWVTQSRET